MVVIPSLRGNEKQQHQKLRYELQKVPGLVNYSFGNVGNEMGEIYIDKQKNTLE